MRLTPVYLIFNTFLFDSPSSDARMSRLKELCRSPTAADLKLADLTESCGRMTSWVTQKLKLTSLLTPVNCDHALICNQMQSLEVCSSVVRCSNP